MNSETSREKWENYWYHYKWHTLIGLFVVFCLVYTVFEFSATKSTDFRMTYIGDYMDTEGLEIAIEKDLKDVVGDFNKDGKTMADVVPIFTGKNIDYTSDLEFWQRFDMDIVNGESYIYLVDEQLLETFLARGVNGVIKTKDGYASYIEITDNEFFKPYLAKDKRVYLCVRKHFDHDVSDKVKFIEEKSLELIEKILEK